MAEKGTAVSLPWRYSTAKVMWFRRLRPEASAAVAGGTSNRDLLRGFWLEMDATDAAGEGAEE